MGEQNAKNVHTACSPIDVDRPKTKDPNRNPETLVVLSAEEQREITIMDCPGTTVLMTLRQFQRDHLFNLGADLEKTCTKKYIRKVWWAFHDEAGDMPHEAGEKSVGQCATEHELSSKWAKVDDENGLCPGHFLHISENNYDPTDIYRYKVDGSFIPDSDQKLIRHGHPNWAYVSFLIEFKRGGTEFDPFDDSPGNDPDATAKTRRAVRGQIMSYAERVFAYQHRTAIFMLFVNGDVFRVMRWDRSGVIVTEAVNYVRTFAGCRALLQVTHALSKLSRIQQGLDTSAVRLMTDSCGYKRMTQLAKPSPFDLDHAERTFDKGADIHQYFVDPEFAATYGLLHSDGQCQLHSDPTHRCRTHRSPPDTIPVFKFIRELFQKSLQTGLPRYRLTVGGREYLVGQHIFLGFGLVGRGTRGYVALDWETQRFVFLKDSWRPYLVDVEQEGAILSKLNKANVMNVPTVLGYGDVYDLEGEDTAVLQETMTSRYHPVRGTLKVDWEERPFIDTMDKESKSVEDLEDWVAQSKEVKPKKDPGKGFFSYDPPNAKTTTSRPLADVVDVHTAPKDIPAFPPGTSQAAAPLDTEAAEPRGTKRSADVMIAEDKRIQGGGLRHMVHTRMIVKEICLPLTAFTSSRQLIRILWECINAHGVAYKRCQYMHRDVSAGNLLIHPRIIVGSDGAVSILWRGLLSDWELAKHSSKKVALQPQRTGTWHFMSAYLLSHPGMPSTIADELESFVHILIYSAARRMRSNMQVIHNFLEAYFAGCDVNPETQKVFCPAAKLDAVVDGATLKFCVPIVFSTPDGKLTKEHPVNSLIAELLELFHSRYVILEWEAYVASESDNMTSAPEAPPSPASYPVPRAWIAGFEAAPEFPVEAEVTPKPKKTPQQPTPEMYANVKALETHGKVLNIFFTYAYSETKVFPPDDVVPDRLSEVNPAREPAAADATKPANATTPDSVANASAADGTRDTSAEAGPSRPTDASAPADGPSSSAADETTVQVHAQADVAPKAEPVAAVITPVIRPAKRRRKDPVLPADPAAATPSSGRMTRSRTAAMLTLAAAAAPPAPQLPPIAQAPTVPRPRAPRAAPAPPAQDSASPSQQDVSLTQTTTRVTRSKTNALPGHSGGLAGPATVQAVVTKRGTTNRSAAVARASGGPGTRRRGGAARRSTEVGKRGRHTRRS